MCQSHRVSEVTLSRAPIRGSTPTALQRGSPKGAGTSVWAIGDERIEQMKASRNDREVLDSKMIGQGGTERGPVGWETEGRGW